VAVAIAAKAWSPDCVLVAITLAACEPTHKCSDDEGSLHEPNPQARGSAGRRPGGAPQVPSELVRLGGWEATSAEPLARQLIKRRSCTNFLAPYGDFVDLDTGEDV
jgi:hypothetical protein